MSRYYDKQRMEILASVILSIREMGTGCWPRDMMFVACKDGKEYTVPPDSIKGFYKNLETYCKQEWPRAWSAVKCYEGWEGLLYLIEKHREERDAALADVEKLKQVLSRLLAAHDLMNADVPPYELVCEDVGSAANALLHSHSTPGIWNRDNGEAARRPCEWCYTIAAARKILTEVSKWTLKKVKGK